MAVAVITGAAGLIGSESVEFFSDKFDVVVGIDNDMRAYFFGEGASIKWRRDGLLEEVDNFKHYDSDIRNYDSLERIFSKYGNEIELIVHTAAQPSHDWAANDPRMDFGINAVGTLNLLELTKKYCPESVFIFTSTNKVYGDRPNSLPLVELSKRWEVDSNHKYYDKGIDESMTIDQSKHSVFGASKVAADVLTQEYGKYFGLKTGIFRGGCLTGPNHSGAQLHGFLSYLMKCAVDKKPYTIFGYKGKQVRDNIHSLDLVRMFWEFYQKPKPGEVYNAGGGRSSNCSMLEAIDLCEHISGNKMDVSYSENNRIGDHIWWVSDTSKFKRDYPNWQQQYTVEHILEEIHQHLTS